MSQIYTGNLRNAVISASSSGANEIIAAPTAPGRIVIDHINFVPAGAVNVTLKSGTTAVSGVYPLTTSQGFVLENSAHHEKGVIECAPGEAFNITLGGAVLISGFVKYRVIGQ